VIQNATNLAVSRGDETSNLFIALVVVSVVLIGLVWYAHTLSTKARRTAAAIEMEENARQANLMAPTQERYTPPPLPAASSVKLDQLTETDPGFSDREFLAIARESFVLVNEAKLRGLPKVASNLLVPELESDLPPAPTPMPHLDLDGAEISGFKIDDGQAKLWVRFNVLGFDLQAKDAPPTRWAEVWTFSRPASTTTAPDDVASLHPGWMVSHKGWRVSEINKLP
jgi:predicted lipid-binding transport protein (Tim44 family)